MTHQEPVEPSAVIARDGGGIPARDRPPRGMGRVGRTRTRMFVPAVIRGLTAGPLVAASALAVAAIAAARAAAVAGHLTRPVRGPASRREVDLGFRAAPPGGGVHITWIHVELHWPPEGGGGRIRPS